VQLLFQDPAASLNGARTIGHHLERPLLIHKRVKDRRELQGEVHALLAAVGLTPPAEMANKFPEQLVGGQHQRAALARALAVDPEVILIDEPITLLDASIRVEILNLLAQLKETYRIAFLYLTRDMTSVRCLADEMIVLHAGHLVEGAGRDELVKEPAHPYTQLLLAAMPRRQTGERHAIDVRRHEPALANPSPGCPFAARCPLALKICREVMPEITPLTTQHWIRCHLYSDDNWLRRT
jgi:peptide/nickel transport system ATP-binding protein